MSAGGVRTPPAPDRDETRSEYRSGHGPEHPPGTRSVLAGGWVAMRSVRRSRERILPDVLFSERAEDTAYGAALIGAFAADPAADDLAAYLEQRAHRPGRPPSEGPS